MEQITQQVVKDIFPLNALSAAAFEKLRPHMSFRWYPQNRMLFKVGDSLDYYLYVLEGSVWMMDEDETEMTTVSHEPGTPAIPLPPVMPSIHRAHAATDSRLLMVDRHKLREVLAEDKPDNAQLREDATTATRTGAAPFSRRPAFAALHPMTSTSSCAGLSRCI
jgi:CRP-like cAMP-binding protein